MDFDAFKETIRACRVCKDRFDHEPRPVIRGNADAPIMQISQAPSKTVHETGLPFNDKSGEKLRRDWYGIDDETFYNPDNFYITSIAKCFPGKTKSGGDKAPPPICAKLWIEKEMKCVDSDIIIIIGKYAANYFFKGQDFHTLVMNDQTLHGRRTLVLPHPSPLNIKWFKDHPDFEGERLPEVRRTIQSHLLKME